LWGYRRLRLPPGPTGCCRSLWACWWASGCPGTSFAPARALVPAALIAAIITSTGIAAALVAASLTSIDAVTAVFAAVPGGLTEMSAVSLSFGADGAAVASVQLVRVLLAIAAVNVLLVWLGPKEDNEDEETESEPQERQYTPTESSGYAEDLKRLGVAVPWGVLAGLAGILSQVPAGGIIGALALPRPSGC
jgi:uncharacterized protein